MEGQSGAWLQSPGQERSRKVLHLKQYRSEQVRMPFDACANHSYA